ncbi:hypothetical protein KKC45_00615, partial [Patescibacteria group bacterium]|nr:hypothetical protein [Patescibacteria group bacterium]
CKMIKNIIIFILIVLLFWTIALKKDPVDTEIIGIGGESSEIMEGTTEIINGTVEQTENIVSEIVKQAKTYCSEASTVYVTEETIKVVSSIPGAGSAYYSLGENTPFNCPVVAPSSMTEECKAMMAETNWTEVCEE